MSEQYLYIYATKHALGGVAASNQIKSQVSGFFSEYGSKFSLFYMQKTKEDVADMEKINSIKIATQSYFYFFYKFFQFLLSQKQIKLIYTRDLLIVIVSILAFKKVTYECHHEASARVRIVLKYFYPLFEIVSISNGLREYFMETLKIPTEKILLLHDAVDYEMYSKATLRRKEYRETLKFSERAIYATYTGTVGPGRDMHNFYKCVINNPRIIFLVLGDDGSSFMKILDISKLPSNIKFKGYLSKEEVLKYQIASDILINLLDTNHPNYKYCSQLKLFEYFASGNIIVSPNIGSLSEVVNINNSLIYFSNSNFEHSLGEVVRRASTNLYDYKYKIIKENAKNFVKGMTWAARARKIVNSYT